MPSSGDVTGVGENGTFTPFSPCHPTLPPAFTDTTQLISKKGFSLTYHKSTQLMGVTSGQDPSALGVPHLFLALLKLFVSWFRSLV